jgi:hypothetical protein
MIEYTIDAAQRLIRVRMSGANTPADLLRHVSDLSADPAFDATFNTLFCITEDRRTAGRAIMVVCGVAQSVSETHRRPS